ncbi:MAG: hypothetical protein RL757_1206 [Bacteroidota bacterium]
MKKIVVTGAESSGKTTLAQALAHATDAYWVSEFARDFLEQKIAPPQYPTGFYEEKDLLTIAKGQIDLENRKIEESFLNKNNFLFFDTDLITIKIWSEEKFGRCDAWILEQIEQRNYDFYLLASPKGIAWQPDPLREHPHERERLFEIYIQNLNFYQKKYAIVTGNLTDRIQFSLEKI